MPPRSTSTTGPSGTLIAVDYQVGSVRLRTDSGGECLLPARYCAEHLEPAYVLTAHGSQGATVDWVGVIGAPGFTRNWAYTALSRSRGPTELFVIDEPNAHASARAEIAPGASVLRRERSSSYVNQWLAATTRTSRSTRAASRV